MNCCLNNMLLYWCYVVEEEIDKSSLLDLTEDMVKELVPKIGQRSKFMSELKKLKILNNNEKVPYIFNNI